MTVILIIASATIQNTESKVRYFAELEATAQARLAAESAAERAITMIRNYEAGYETSEDNVFCSGITATHTTCTSYGDYEIYAKGTELTDDFGSTNFYIPIAGTGTAGLSDECSVMNVTGDYANPDHPCNWNKLMYGESVTIPLYSSDESGTGILTAADLGISSWSLRLRTPCANGSYESDCDGDVRMKFDTTGSELSSGDTIILWQIIYDDGVGNMEALVPDDAVIPFGFTDDRGGDNTEVYEKLINDEMDAGTFEVLNSDDIAGYAGTVDALEAVLQLNIVSTLSSDTGIIPYLEWQLKMDNMAIAPFADPKSVILGEGFYEGNGKTYYFPYTVTRYTVGEGSTAYTLSN